MVGAVVSRTPNYGFARIRYDVLGWGSIEQDNWTLVDALLASAGSIPSLRGVWLNSELYTAGDRVADTSTATVWRAAVTHTSAASGTFAAARAANPTYWTAESSVPTYTGAWATATNYQTDDIVSINDGWYLCRGVHTSGVFATDLAADLWALIVDNGPVIVAAEAATDAADAATAAANSALENGIRVDAAQTHTDAEKAQARVNIGIARLVATKTANYTVTIADAYATLVATGATSWTLSLPAAATAGNGFIISLRNSGTGIVTIDPNGSETVNGATTLGAYQGDSVELICDGTGWHALFQSPFSIVAAETLASARANVELALPSEFTSFDLRLDGFEPVSSATLAMRMSIDGGATYYSNSGAYFWQQGYDSGSSGSSVIYNHASGGSAFTTTGIELSTGSQGAQNGVLNLIDIEFSKRGVARIPGIKWTGAFGAGYVNRGQGSLGVSAADLTNIRLLYSTANIGSGARYKLIGMR